MPSVLGLIVGQVAARKRLQAGIIQAVAQPRLLGEIVECAGLIQPKPADAGAPQRGQVTADAEGGADPATVELGSPAAQAIWIVVS